ncbi:ATP-binding protein [bacterium]|nr:ATP-binding protein [bacterium]
MNFRRPSPSDVSIPEATLSAEREGLCPDCDGYGNIIENGVARPCHCRIERELTERLTVARIPERYRHCSLDNFSTDSHERERDLKAMRWALKEMLGKPGRGIYIHGEHGVGKTHLAVAILRELVKQGKSGVYYNVVDLLDQMRDSMRAESGPGAQQLLGFHMDWEVLLLDDLGVQRASPWVVERLHAIVNARYESNRVLIITSNKTLEAATANLNRAITSRLREMCIVYAMQAQEDYRNRLAEKSAVPEKPRRGRRRNSEDE